MMLAMMVTTEAKIIDDGHGVMSSTQLLLVMMIIEATIIDGVAV